MRISGFMSLYNKSLIGPTFGRRLVTLVIKAQPARFEVFHAKLSHTSEPSLKTQLLSPSFLRVG